MSGLDLSHAMARAILIGLALSASCSADGGTTPCPMPNPDAQGLFTLIKAPQTTSNAVAAFLQSHVVAWDAVNEKCETTIDVAIDGNRADLADVLFDQYRPDLSAKPRQARDSIYSYAVAHGTLAMNDWVRREATSSGQSLTLKPAYPADLSELMLAVGNNPDVNVTQNLLNSGADPNQATSTGKTVLMIAAEHSANVDLIQTLLAAGASLYPSDSYGTTALLFAAGSNSDEDIAKYLIQKGANVNAKDGRGDTPLMLASNKDTDSSLVEALLTAGADVNAVDVDRKSALMWAAAHPSGDSVVAALLQHQPNVNGRDSYGKTVLMIAVDTGLTADTIRSLIRKGADINVSDSSGMNALMYATKKLNLDIAQVLIQGGASINQADTNGATALIYVAFPFDPKCAKAQSQHHYDRHNWPDPHCVAYQEPLQDKLASTLVAAGADRSIKCNSCSLSNDTDRSDPSTAADIASGNDAPGSLIRILRPAH